MARARKKPDPELIKLKQQEIALLEAKVRHQEDLNRLEEEAKQKNPDLPHLHGWKWYKWARAFFESVNRMNLLTAGNQLSKSSTQIRKAIHWATAKYLWARLWTTKPAQFWYFYPSKDVATVEFDEKWVKEFLPRGAMKDHPIYGWTEEKERRGGKKVIHCIRFNSGVTIYFKSYHQKEVDLQTATVHAVFIDEELPENLYQEVRARIRGIRGYFHAVFTATLGQDFWRRTMEPTQEEKAAGLEKFPKAFKQQVSAYDCMEYDDGSPGPWTAERIQDEIDSCESEDEVARRIDGRFIPDISERTYAGFDWNRNFQPFHPVPATWNVYPGIDIGSGGPKGHPAAISFVAVSPDYMQGRVIKFWRGDKIVTTSGDVLGQYLKMKRELGRPVMPANYDWHNADFRTLAGRSSVPIVPAEKGHQIGEQTLNTLLKSGMLVIYDDVDGEAKKLGQELRSLKKSTAKNQAKDDGSDSLRYACARVPWDFSAIPDLKEEAMAEVVQLKTELEERQERAKRKEDPEAELNAEFDEWNEAYG